MSALTLYRIDRQVDPITIAVRAWVTLCEIPNFSEVTSGYYWCAAGQLPVLLYKHYVFTKDNILDFFRLVYDLEDELTLEKRQLSKLIQEECYSKLYPSILYALFMDEDTPKDFLNPSRGFLESLLSSPLNKVRFNLEKNKTTEFLDKQHGIRSAESALSRCDQAHESLSALLGSKPFYFSELGQNNHPRCVDIIVYSYLAYELLMLSKHNHVEVSLMKYMNLIEFVQRVEDSIRLKIKARGMNVKEFQFVTKVKEYGEEYFCSKVYECPLEIADDQWGKLVYKLGGDEPVERRAINDVAVDKAYLAGFVGVLFFFFYFKGN